MPRLASGLAASLCVIASAGMAASANVPLRDTAPSLRGSAFVPGAPSVLSSIQANSFVCKGRACNVAPLRAAKKRFPFLRSVNMVAAPEGKVQVDDAVAQFVKERGGNLPIRKILIANNGMAATKSILSMRQWAYMQLGDERAIKFVAMATPEDLNANAEFVRLADSFVEVPGGKNSNNYANVDLIVQTAIAEGVDAVWPGWGHASENPKLPNTLKANGIKFIGPTGPVMAVLGDKIAANILAQTAEVPSIPWSGSFGGPEDGPLVAELNDEGVIPDEIFNKAMVTTVEEACASAARIGYPVMLKASEGGGGKGIRMSDNEEQLRNNFVQVQNEVPGSPMFMMQLCKNARHLEVQIVGDEHGNAVALNGRDCSTQRRFQKIFEEGPPTIAKPETFRKMELAAMRLTKSIGYIGAGTVEYLYNADEDKFFFLELNPRLQVEHPVTEGLTGVNLPSTQLQVAMGIPLSNMPEIRALYGKKDLLATNDPIDFLEEEYRPIGHHVIAARITAENPDEGFKPTSGKIERVKFQASPSVWGYFSVGNNGGIHEFADSQFGHLFATGPTREDARKSLVLALKQIDVRGEIRNPVEYLVQLLETNDFKANNIDTSWLDGIIRDKSVKTEIEDSTAVVGAAVFRSYANIKAEMAKLADSLAKGQTGVSEVANINSFPMEITFNGVKYPFQVRRSSPDRITLSLGEENIDVKIREQSDGSLLCNFGGSARKLYGQEEPLGLRLVLDGQTVILPNVFDPSELRSDVTGKVVRYLFEEGEEAPAGAPFVELEAMKMIMQLKTTEAGKISPALSAGSIINTGDLLANVELKDPSKVAKIEAFDGKLDIRSADSNQDPLHLLELALKGYPGVDQGTEVSRAFINADAEACVSQTLVLLEQYLAIESSFSGKALDLAVADLIAANKDNTAPVIDVVVAHLALKSRNEVVLTLLRSIASLPDRFPSFKVTSELSAMLDRLAALQGSDYTDVALVASSVKAEFNNPDLSARLSELSTFIMEDTPAAIASSRKLSVSVDLLSELFDHNDEKVARAALEVYVRRVYRAHDIVDVTFDTVDGIQLIKWKFTLRDLPDQEAPVRFGMLAVVDKAADVSGKLSGLLEHLKTAGANAPDGSDMLNTFHLAINERTRVPADAGAYATTLAADLKAQKDTLRSLGVRHVNYLVRQEGSPRYFTFLECHEYDEEPIRRDMRASFPYLLELTRLEGNYDLTRIDALGRNAQLWIGTEKRDDNVVVSRPRPQTIFLRAISHSMDTDKMDGADRLMVSAMDELDRALLNPLVTGTKKMDTAYPIQYGTASARIFLHVLNEFEADTQSVIKGFKGILDGLLAKHSTRLLSLRVDEIEVKARISYMVDGKKHVQPIRLVASSTSGDWLKTDAYLEYPDPITGVTKQFRSLEEAQAGVMQISPYPSSNTVQMKRASARRVGSTYAFDFLGLMEVGLIQQWAKRPDLTMPPSGSLLSAKELVMGADGEISEQTRPVGSNTIGMLAWIATIKSPEYPEGREVVIIANDVTVQSGSFGVAEDDFFFKASELARKRGIPRLYIACNSGARIGLIEDLKPKFKVEWIDEANPGQGFKYLYLSDEDYKALPEGTVEATKTMSGSETRWALDCIVGNTHGIGVENLRGSGLIAGETSRAYQETFTLSFVTGRSVGIGAYLVRLGQRTIQMVDGPLILTGYSALNKLLGKEVYTSQDQLGGPQVMIPNGVSHQQVPNDQEGVNAMLDWLSFVPKDVKSPPPILPAVDPVDRDIEFMPTKAAYDPRHMLAGAEVDGKWQSGFFDKGTFKEYLAGWGKSVVVGRARLGGVPMGVIAVETRLSERRIPADPANPESRETVEQQAGQVWFPDSAFKTAQAIADFNRGENLPLIIFANWRGFSGGTRDMANEILKFGAKIVDALREYKHPVFIYLPPNGELRGGAWVVVDPTINEQMMEMYADTESRGGILEPPGICEVKFRKQDQIKTMHRLDKELIELDAKLAAATADNAAEIKAAIAKRENTLLPLYLQIAHEFADLHDRAGRMKAKGVVRDALNWKRSREFFYWRASRRVFELELRKQVTGDGSTMTFEEATKVMQDMCPCDWDDDKAVLEWLKGDTAAIDTQVKALNADRVAAAVEAMLAKLSADERQNIVGRLR